MKMFIAISAEDIVISKFVKYVPSLAWPDTIYAQGHYRLQYKRPARKGSGPVHRPDWNRDYHRGGGC